MPRSTQSPEQPPDLEHAYPSHRDVNAVAPYDTRGNHLQAEKRNNGRAEDHDRGDRDQKDDTPLDNYEAGNPRRRG